MGISRRKLMALGAASAGWGLTQLSPLSAAASKPAIKAIAFDGFPIFDPRPVLGTAKSLYGDKGGAFAVAFRTRLFEYQWLRALGNRYKDFFSIIDDAHTSAARSIGQQASADNRAALGEAFLSLNAWPDVPDALSRLKKQNIKLAFLSNMTADMLNTGIRNSGLEGMFDHVLSTDEIKTFKPDPRAYQMGVDAFGLPREEIAFAAFAGWDAAGASWFGYPTVWVNRLGFGPDMLDARIEQEGHDLSVLETFVKGS